MKKKPEYPDQATFGNVTYIREDLATKPKYIIYIVDTDLGDVIGVYDIDTVNCTTGETYTAVDGCQLNETVCINGRDIGDHTGFGLDLDKHRIFMQKKDAMTLSKKLRSKPLKAFEKKR